MRQFDRRLATIISSDVVGYSRLMGQDEEATLAILKACREVIAGRVARYKGRLFGVAGDSWMAEFASPVNALRCALEIQKALRDENKSVIEDKRVIFRLGIHLGDVIDDGQDLFGDEVNIAARLQERAEPGHIVISHAVHTHVSHKVDAKYEYLGRLQLKNIKSAVGGFAVVVPEGEGPSAAIERKTKLQASAKLATPVQKRPLVAIARVGAGLAAVPLDILADGLVLDIRAALSPMRRLSVVSELAMESPSAPSHGLPTFSCASGAQVQYLLTARMWQEGEGLKAQVDLIEREGYQQLWSEQFDASFSREDNRAKLLPHILSALNREIERAEYERCKSMPVAELGTSELVFRAAQKTKTLRYKDLLEAEALLERALVADPSCHDALLQMGWVVFWQLWKRIRLDDAFNKVSELARTVLRNDSRDARAHLLLGSVDLLQRNQKGARFHIHNSIELCSTEALAFAALGTSYVLGGEPERALENLYTAQALSKHDAYEFIYNGELAMAHYLLGQWTKACEYAEASLRLRPGYWYAEVSLICSLTRMNKIEGARYVLQRSPQRFTPGKIRLIPFCNNESLNYVLGGIEEACYNVENIVDMMPVISAKRSENFIDVDTPSAPLRKPASPSHRS